MKKLFLIVAIVFSVAMMTACRTTIQTISPTKYANEVDAVNKAIGALGYHLSGTSSDEKNEVYVSSVFYDNSTGYSNSEMKNNYWWYDTYRFTDSAHNTASYQIKYQSSTDSKGAYYISNVSLIWCDCSNPDDYSKICGDSGYTKSFKDIDNDQESSFVDRGLITACSVILVSCVVVGLLLLP